MFEGSLIRGGERGPSTSERSHRVPVLAPGPSQAELAMAESYPEMLPGIRFLFAAVALSVSVLVFGLGAVALLWAAHEQFASNPPGRAPPEPVLAQKTDAPQPVLAM